MIGKDTAIISLEDYLKLREDSEKYRSLKSQHHFIIQYGEYNTRNELIIKGKDKVVEALKNTLKNAIINNETLSSSLDKIRSEKNALHMTVVKYELELKSLKEDSELTDDAKPKKKGFWSWF
jgi:hypothetical protein